MMDFITVQSLLNVYDHKLYTVSLKIIEDLKVLFFHPQDANIEAEEFTRQLYVELKSSPQPHLVPFLKVELSVTLKKFFAFRLL